MADHKRASIVEIIKSFILREFLPGEDPAALVESTPLRGSGILDSISTLRLVAFVEEQFGVTIEAHEASANFETLGAIADLVISKQQ
jgi:acyl carrier protein